MDEQWHLTDGAEAKDTLGRAVEVPIFSLNPVAYTAIFGSRDTLKDPAVVTSGWRYVCFTDQLFHSDIWEIVHPQRQYSDSRRESRRFKMLPHQFFLYQYSLWVDGSFRINADLGELFKRYLRRADVAVFSHPDRDCIFDEAEICIQLGLDDPVLIRQQINRYSLAGFPRRAGLVSAGVLLRRHTPKIIELNEAWWREYDENSCRDQLSFNFCAWRLGVTCEVIPGNIRKSSELELLGHSPTAPAASAQ